MKTSILLFALFSSITFTAHADNKASSKGHADQKYRSVSSQRYAVSAPRRDRNTHVSNQRNHRDSYTNQSYRNHINNDRSRNRQRNNNTRYRENTLRHQSRDRNYNSRDNRAGYFLGGVILGALGTNLYHHNDHRQSHSDHYEYHDRAHSYSGSRYWSNRQGHCFRVDQRGHQSVYVRTSRKYCL